MHTYVYQVNFKNEASLDSMQNFSKIYKVIVIVQHSDNEIIYIFTHRILLSSSLYYSRMTFFHMKHKTKLKHKRNVALYNSHDLDNPHHLESNIRCVNDISNALTAQYCHNELG